MSIEKMKTTIKELLELQQLADELSVEIEALKDQIKAEMNARGVEALEAGTHIVRWTSVLSTRFDSNAFKKFAPDVYQSFTKQVSSRKFTIA